MLFVVLNPVQGNEVKHLFSHYLSQCSPNVFCKFKTKFVMLSALSCVEDITYKAHKTANLLNFLTRVSMK